MTYRLIIKIKKDIKAREMDQREKTFHIKPENLASVPMTHWRKEKTLSCMLNLDLLMLYTQTHTQIN